MKKWSLVVAALYGLILVALFIPVTAIAFIKKSNIDMKWPAEAFRDWGVWLIIAALVTAQFALLRVPVAVANRRPVKQRSLWTTVIAAAFMMGLLVSGASLSVYEAIAKDVDLPWKDKHWPGTIAIAVLIWVAWAIYFHRATKSSAPDIQMGKLKRFLWPGSILDLLIAIPAHIVARHRDYCCAGYLTFIGLTCGISVMLFAFGPAVYFLFVERWKRLHPKD